MKLPIWYCEFQRYNLKSNQLCLVHTMCSINSFIILSILFFCFLGPHLWHMEAPRLGVESELQLPIYTTATATLDLSCVCDLHYSSRQHQSLNPLSGARDRTRVLMDPSWVRYHGATTGTPINGIYYGMFTFCVLYIY